MPHRALAVLGCLLVCALPACASQSRLCDRAAALAGQAKLAEAAQTYARAERESDDSCAAKGLDSVTRRQATAFAATARGRAAEAAGDQRGAESAYQAALAVDEGAAEAAAGLRRVTRRPAAIDPVWFRAQRLADEGYDVDARAEVLAVLKKHPDRTVPQPLAHLRAIRPSPAATPVPAAAPRPAPASTSGLVVAALLVLVGAMALVAGWAGWQLRRIGLDGAGLARRLDAIQPELRQAIQESESSVATQLRAEITDVRRTAAGLRATIAAVRDSAAADAARADRHREQLEATVARQRKQLGRIFRAVSALRPDEAPVVEEYYEHGGSARPKDTP